MMKPLLGMTSGQRIAVILGAADGLTLAISEIISLRYHQPAIFRAGLGAGLGELVGMGAAVWLSQEEGQTKAGFIVAVACGVATGLSCVIPCLPFLVSTGAWRWYAAGGLAVALGAVICLLRPEKGIIAIAETYGVLAAAGALCLAAGYI
jgi:hypothetical protein